MIKESLNCWLWTDSFLLLFKIASDEHEVASESFCKRYRHSDFLYSRNDQYKITDLHFFEKQHVEKYLMINLIKFDCRKVKLNDNLKIHYNEWPCEIYTLRPLIQVRGRLLIFEFFPTPTELIKRESPPPPPLLINFQSFSFSIILLFPLTVFITEILTSIKILHRWKISFY